MRTARMPVSGVVTRTKAFSEAGETRGRLRSRRNSSFVGIGLLVLFVLVSGGSDVVVGNALQTYDTFALLLVSAAMTWMIFLGINGKEFVSKHGLSVFQVSGGHLGSVVGMNLGTAAGWSLFFISLKLIEPAVAAAICCGFTPISSVFLAPILRPNHRLSRIEILASLAILVPVIVLAGTTLLGESALSSPSVLEAALGVCFAALSGTTNLVSQMYAKKLTDRNFSARDIMVARYPLFILIVLCAILIKGDFTLGGAAGIPALFLLALIAHTVPSFLAQEGCARVEPITFSFLYTLVPISAMVLQPFDDRLNFSWFSWIGVSGVAVAAVVGVWARAKVHSGKAIRASRNGHRKQLDRILHTGRESSHWKSLKLGSKPKIGPERSISAYRRRFGGPSRGLPSTPNRSVEELKQIRSLL